MTKIINAKQAIEALNNSDMLYSAEQIDKALERLALEISGRLQDTDPLVLVVMNGALMPASQLSLRMSFPFQISYLHATRYRGDTQGSTINWVARPNVPIQDRTILVIDDIFDEGTTLKAIIEEMKLLGAKKIYSAVLVNKVHNRKEDLTVDFIGLDVEDRYVFGYGMDYKEYWRNLPAIYAIKE
jgi:hypoxanthine phosphoribosyltransferase